MTEFSNSSNSEQGKPTLSASITTEVFNNVASRPDRNTKDGADSPHKNIAEEESKATQREITKVKAEVEELRKNEHELEREYAKLKVKIIFCSRYLLNNSINCVL